MLHGIREDEMAGACSMHESDKKMHAEFWSENLGVDGMIILEWILEKLGGNVWTGSMWRSLVKRQ
jgi:hypothetical protein